MAVGSKGESGLVEESADETCPGASLDEALDLVTLALADRER